MDEDSVMSYLWALEILDFQQATETEDEVLMSTGHDMHGHETLLLTEPYPIPVNDSIGIYDVLGHRYSHSGLRKTIGIDYRLLDGRILDDVVNLYNSGIIYGIRILPEGTDLTPEIYSRLSSLNIDDDFLLAANDSSIDCRFDFRKESNICKIEKVDTYDNLAGDYNLHTNIHVGRELNEDELKELVEIANSNHYDNIFFNFYDPSYYARALEILKENGLNSNIDITILANPLYDVKEVYNNLDGKCDNNVRVHYNTCNDLNEYYKDYRSSELQYYYSDLEASGICSLDDYLGMVDTISKIEDHIGEKEYSDLEKLVYVYDYFKKNYIYDPDYESAEHSLNAQLDRVAERDRMVCEGFSNLYSCVCRRMGIPCFTVGVDDHQYNAVRITDPKYGVDNIALLDVTWDIGDKMELNDDYRNFLRKPDAKLYDTVPSTLNVLSSLFVSDDIYNNFVTISNPGYVTDHFGYSRRMLELMGLGVESPEPHDVRSAFINSGMQEEIPTDVLNRAINQVRTQEGDYSLPFYPTLSFRNSFGVVPTVRSNLVDGDSFSFPVLLHIPDRDVHFIDVDPQHQDLYHPREREEGENLGEYLDFCNNHYHGMFYPDGIVLEANSGVVEEVTEEENIEPVEGIETDEINENLDTVSEEQESEYIPGTNILKPRDRGIYETDEEYIAFLRDYYNNVFASVVNDDSLNRPLIDIYEENEDEDVSVNEENSDREAALQNYKNSGYGQNAEGHYFNIWIDEYDPDYKPWEDAAFNPNIVSREDPDRDTALQNYKNSGYGQNVDGDYYNIWIDEYDHGYKPWEDAVFNPNLEDNHTLER